MKFSAWKSENLFAGLAVGIALLLAASINVLMEYVVHRTVLIDTKERLEKWVPYYINNIENLHEMVTSQDFDPSNLDFVAHSQGIGAIFQVKLYDTLGRQIYSSGPDHQNDQGPEISEPEEKPLWVIANQEHIYEAKSGHDHVGLPEHYTEMYIPVQNSQSELSGVVELYIDLTRTHQLYHKAFSLTSIAIGALIALAFGLPALAFVKQARREAEVSKKANYLTRYDPLTNLLNRVAFNEQFKNLLSKSAHSKTQVAIAYLDIDDFKLVNDENGHETGDMLLKHVANAIRSVAGECVLASRFGGDEMVFVLEDCNEERFTQLLSEIMDAVRKPILTRNTEISGKVSIGGHVFIPYQGADVDFALHRADLALYQAKSAGKNCMRLFRKEFEIAHMQSRLMENRLCDAVNNGDFEVFYQLLLDSSTQEYNGFEALLRLPDGRGGYISPDDFIPVAERMGIITEIGKWVLDHAVSAASKWPEDLVLAVNLSPRQFSDGVLVKTVQNVLSKHNFAASRLQLEITESLLIEDSSEVNEQLRDLQLLGIAIAMDDFGTGYSSLGYLWKYNFDKIKIDRSFILEIGRGADKAYEIVETIVNLGHKLNATVTAEGIETTDQAKIMQKLRCDEFQGFHFSRPLPEIEVTKLLEKRRNSAA